MNIESNLRMINYVKMIADKHIELAEAKDDFKVTVDAIFDTIVEQTGKVTKKDRRNIMRIAKAYAENKLEDVKQDNDRLKDLINEL